MRLRVRVRVQFRVRMRFFSSIQWRATGGIPVVKQNLFVCLYLIVAVLLFIGFCFSN